MIKEIKYSEAIKMLLDQKEVMVYERISNVGYINLDSLIELKETGKFFVDVEEEPVKEEPKPVKQPKKPSAKKPVDHGKIIALHNAGWDSAKIADEIGCTISCVYNHLSKEGLKPSAHG